MVQFVGALLQPLTLSYLIAAMALVLLWRRRQEKRRRLVVLTVAFGALTVLCLPATANIALGSLEWQYAPLDRRPDDAAVIVVLSGSLRAARPDGTRVELSSDTLYRCLRVAELYRESPCPVLVSGGKVHSDDPGPALADAMRAFLLTQAIPDSDILLERHSRNTAENARETAQLLAARQVRRIVLITDAAHLPRAVGCFRKQGLAVVPCGCRYRALGLRGNVSDYLPDPNAAVGVAAACHEWLGLAWYWLTDKL